jgi:hypothetical protein
MPRRADALVRLEPPGARVRWLRIVDRGRVVCPHGHHVRVAARSNDFLTVRCTKCPAILAMWVLRDQRVFLAEISPAEYHVIEEQRLTPTQVLEYLELWPTA